MNIHAYIEKVAGRARKLRQLQRSADRANKTLSEADKRQQGGNLLSRFINKIQDSKKVKGAERALNQIERQRRAFELGDIASYNISRLNNLAKKGGYKKPKGMSTLDFVRHSDSKKGTTKWDLNIFKEPFMKASPTLSKKEKKKFGKLQGKMRPQANLDEAFNAILAGQVLVSTKPQFKKIRKQSPLLNRII